MTTSLYTCFEHQYIFCGKDIAKPCFDWLVAQDFAAFTLASKQGELCLKTQQYVGVITTPFGTQIEILPKIAQADDHSERIQYTRTWLTKLLNTQYLPQAKALQTFANQSEVTSQPVHEWLIQQFLHACERIISSGVSSHYQSQQQNEAYLRGKLNVAENIRQNQAKLRSHQFAQTTDTRQHNSPENRLLLHTLYFLASHQHTPQQLFVQPSQLLYKRFSEQLHSQVSSVQALAQYQQQYLLDFQQSQQTRLPPPYHEALPIAKLILAHTANGAGVGQTQGISLLFNMQTLFERMVASTLAQTLADDESLHFQQQHIALLTDSTGKAAWSLRPDMHIRHSQSQQVTKVIDAKWKLIHHEKLASSISQADVYQMFAYASSYFPHSHFSNSHATPAAAEPTAQVWLIYPKTAQFQQAAVFEFNHIHARLHVLPFDVAVQRIIY